MANALNSTGNPSGEVIGFSGTKDNNLLLPLHVKQSTIPMLMKWQRPMANCSSSSFALRFSITAFWKPVHIARRLRAQARC